MILVQKRLGLFRTTAAVGLFGLIHAGTLDRAFGL